VTPLNRKKKKEDKNFLLGMLRAFCEVKGGCCKYATVERVIYNIYLPPPIILRGANES